MPEEPDKSAGEDANIPPPLDPFPTYQTPYSRHNADNENPFISFRRFADEQFNSFFSGLPSILGGPTSRSSQSGTVNKSFETQSSEQASRLEAELNDMIRRRHEEAEGFRKQIEQEREERRMENEKRNQEERAQWELMQRGLERCPGLRHKTNEPSTELDMYDRMEEQRYEEDNRRRNCRWKEEGKRGWLSGLGWDGRGRRRNVHKGNDSKPTPQQDLSPLNLEPEEHLADLDPFKHEEDLHAYLTESKYSPIHLMLPNCFAAWRSPTSCPESNSMSDAPSATELDRRMADRLQWSEAFNDLLSFEKTGELPPREHASIFNMAPFRASIHGPFSDPFSREMKRLIEKTPRRDSEDDSFREGDFWDGDIDISPLGTGIMALLMGAALSGIPARAISDNKPISRREIESEQKKDQNTESRQDDSDVRGMFWPGPEAILSLIDRVKQQELEPSSQNERAEEDARAQSSARDSPSSSFSSSSTSMSSWSASNNSIDNPNSIISTLTTTQTRTLPDGTTETKRVLKRRFADGREEHDESVEVRPGSTNRIISQSTAVPSISSEVKVDHMLPSPASSQIQKAVESKPKERESRKHNDKDKSTQEKSGWFWN